jgi:hypothetical protein
MRGSYFPQRFCSKAENAPAVSEAPRKEFFMRVSSRLFFVLLSSVFAGGAVCMPSPALASNNAVYTQNPTKLDAWVTVQDGAKIKNLAAYRVAAGKSGSYYNRGEHWLYIRYEFMEGNKVKCDTKAKVNMPGPAGPVFVSAYYQPGHCHIKS